MQLWFSRDGEVPIREQLVTQIVLGILCGDLAPGERLPSTRELARRSQIHANTVSAGYRELERQGWVDSRHGSGVYVRRKPPAAALSPDLALDQSIARLFHSVRKLGVPSSALRTRLRHWLARQPPDHFLVVEPDEDLREIVIAEMARVVTLPVRGCSIVDCTQSGFSDGAIPVALPSKTAMARTLLPPEAELLTLHVRSIQSSLAGYLPAPTETLIGIASRWGAFLELARIMLVAAGFHPDSLVVRDCKQPGWQVGLQGASAVVCDSVTAALLPRKPPVVCFSLLAEASLTELRRCEQLILNADLRGDLGANIGADSGGSL